MTSVTMDEPTLVFVTIARPQCAIRLIQSARDRFPAMPIEMVEQVDGDSELEAVCRTYRVGRTAVPFDSGVSVCRNLALAKAKTPYVVLADDDFVFTEATSWDKAIGFLDGHPDFGFVGGELEAPDRAERTTAFLRSRNFAFDETAKGLLMVPAAAFAWNRIAFEGETFQVCDMVSQWGVARAEILREQRWDERFKTGGEHLDLFLRLRRRQPRSRVAFSTCLKAEHRSETNETYRALRERRDWVEIFGGKWGLDYILPAGGNLRNFRSYDEIIPIWSEDAAATMIDRQSAIITRLREHQVRQAEAIARKDEVIRRLKRQP